MEIKTKIPPFPPPAPPNLQELFLPKPQSKEEQYEALVLTFYFTLITTLSGLLSLIASATVDNDVFWKSGAVLALTLSAIAALRTLSHLEENKPFIPSLNEMLLYIHFNAGQLTRIVRFLYDAGDDSQARQSAVAVTREMALFYAEGLLTLMSKEDKPQNETALLRSWLKENEVLRDKLLEKLKKFYGIKHIEDLHEVLYRQEKKLEGDEVSQVLFTSTFPNPDFPVEKAIQLLLDNFDFYGDTITLNRIDSIGGRPSVDLFELLMQGVLKDAFEKILKRANIEERPIIIAANVAKGVMTGALIATAIKRLQNTSSSQEKRKLPPVVFSYYRYSPYKSRDAEVKVGEVEDQIARLKAGGWANEPIIIIADALSAGGMSVPLSIKAMKTINPNAVYLFLTEGGRYWLGTKGLELMAGFKSIVAGAEPVDLSKGQGNIGYVIASLFQINSEWKLEEALKRRVGFF